MKTVGFAFVVAYLVMIGIAIQPKIEQEIFIFYTGEIQGELEPCGCSGVKSGGILQRSGWIENLKQARPNFILVDGGFCATQNSRQQYIKFDFYHQMLHILDYDFTFFSAEERSSEKWLAFNKDISSKIVRKNGQTILIVKMEKNEDLEEISNLIRQVSPDIVVCTTKNIGAKIPENFPLGNYLTFFLVNDAKEPIAAFSPQEKVVIASAGNRGRYAGLFQIDNANWQHKHITITEKYKSHRDVVQKLELYKSRIKSAQLLNFEIKRSSRVGFVGTDMCKSCHVQEHREWLLEQDHAKAFATLQRQNYHHDPECVKCHVVGYSFMEGFQNLEESDYLINVGCESCHGAGAQHAFAPQKYPNYGKTNGEEACTKCHNKDHSPHFEYNAYKQRIKHWKDD